MMKAHRERMKIFLYTMLILLVLGCITAALGQEAEADTFKESVAPAESTLTLWQLIKQGGITMIPLALCSIAVVALVIRNFIALKTDKMLRPDALPQIQHSLSQGDITAAQQAAASNDCMLTTALKAGLNRITSDTVDMESVREAIAQSGKTQMTRFMKPINYLSNIGAVSPMLGLLGTVSGMIKAFRNISISGMGNPEKLAGNIGEALVTTATGLIIAIPAMLFYFYFKNSFADTVSTMGQYISNLLNTLQTGEMMPLDEAGTVLEPQAQAEQEEPPQS